MPDLPSVRRSFILATLSLLLVPSAVLCEIPSDWQKRFERIDKQLHSGKWKAAKAGSVELAQEMAGQITPGHGARRLMALIATYRAVAEAGLEQPEEAAWSWLIAQNLSPEFARLELPDWKKLPGGESPGAFLGRHTLRTAGKAPPHLAVTTLAPDDPLLTPPAPLNAPAPERSLFPLRHTTVGEIFVEVVIDEAGHVAQPVVLRGDHPGTVYLTLDSMREWLFQPAKTQGRPVAALHRVNTSSKPLSFGLVAARSEPLLPIHLLLLEERWEEAGEAASQAIDDALACQDVPKSACRPADLLVLRAVAEAGLGRSEDALWHWHMAHTFRSLQPDSLAFYGAAGRWLDDHTPRCHTRGAACDALDVNRVTNGVQPPRVIATHPLALPETLWQISGLERLDARLVVDEDGRPREPLLLTDRSPAAGYYALKALREWRFEPALRDGQPIAALVEVTVPLPSSAPPEALAAWRLQLQAAEALLGAGQWQEALDASLQLTPEIVAGIRDGGSDLLAQAVAQQALAEAGLGLEEEAIWHWQMAQILALHYRILDLSGYGAAGKILELYRSQRPDIADSGKERALAVVRQATEPTYPEYAAALNDFGIFEILVDADGKPRAPRIVAGRAPGLLHAALEALSTWTFEPPPDGVPETLRVQMVLSPKAPLAQIKAKPGAMTLAHMAVNEARSGDPSIAGCYWHAAIGIDPAIERTDLSRLGAAGRALIEGLTPPKSLGGDKALGATGPHRVGGDVQKPVKVSAPQPQYGEIGRASGVQGSIHVEAIIDERGYVAGARILKGLSPEMDVETIRAMCRWRFKPATLGGKPVPVYYNLMTNYSIGRRGP